LSPIVDPQNPYGTFSVLGTQAGYALFGTTSNTCYEASPSTDSESINWGTLKGLYR
jgi:hypothetical protein